VNQAGYTKVALLAEMPPAAPPAESGN